MGIIEIAMAIGEFVPSVIGWFTGDKDDEKKAAGIVDIVKGLTGVDDPNKALASFQARTDLQVKIKTLVLDYQYKFQQEKTKQLQVVNATMIAESKSEHWMQWSWRPFNGFLFGITLFIGYVVPAITNVILAAFGVFDEMVLRQVPYANIPEFVLVAWGAVLGVTSWWRGKGKMPK